MFRGYYLKLYKRKKTSNTAMNGEFCQLSESVRVLMLKSIQNSKKLFIRDVADFVYAHLGVGRATSWLGPARTEPVFS